jgi:hypothetical protein
MSWMTKVQFWVEVWILSSTLDPDQIWGLYIYPEDMEGAICPGVKQPQLEDDHSPP